MAEADGFGRLTPNDFEVTNLLAFKFAAANGAAFKNGVRFIWRGPEARIWIYLRVLRLLLCGFGEGEINEMIFRKFRIDNDVEETALAFESNLGSSF